MSVHISSQKVQNCRHMAEYKRAWLEVLKYLEPNELLSTELVSRSLRAFCSANEVWALHIREAGPFPTSIKALCRDLLPTPTFLAYFKYSDLTIVDLRTSLHCTEAEKSLSSQFLWSLGVTA